MGDRERYTHTHAERVRESARECETEREIQRKANKVDSERGKERERQSYEIGILRNRRRETDKEK